MLLASATIEVAGAAAASAAVAVATIQGVFWLAAKRSEKNGRTRAPDVACLPCGPHGERLASLENEQRNQGHRLESIAQDVKEINISVAVLAGESEARKQRYRENNP